MLKTTNCLLKMKCRTDVIEAAIIAKQKMLKPEEFQTLTSQKEHEELILNEQEGELKSQKDLLVCQSFCKFRKV